MVTHYGKQPPPHPPSLSDTFQVSQIGHKFWTWSHKCQKRGGKQTDKFLQRDGRANDYYGECEGERERLALNNAKGVFRED